MTFEEEIQQRLEEDKGPQIVGPAIKLAEKIPIIQQWTLRVIDWLKHVTS